MTTAPALLGMTRSMTDIDLDRLDLSGKRPWRVERNLRILYDEHDLSATDAGDVLGCSGQTVLDWIERSDDLKKRDQHASKAPELDDANWLREEYENKRRSSINIGDELGVTAQAVLERLRDHDIPRRGTHTLPPELDDAAYLRKAYIHDRMTSEEIGNEIGCSMQTVLDALREHKIPVRQGGGHTDAADVLGDKEAMSQLYLGEELSTRKIAGRLDCGQTTVHRALEDHEIETRPPGHLSGKDHPRWTDDPKIKYYGPNWTEQREATLERDGYVCRISGCDVTDAEHVERHRRGLSVHHVDPVEHYTERAPDGSVVSFDHERANRDENLIALCQRHHKRYEGVPLDTRSLAAAPSGPGGKRRPMNP